MTFQYLKIKPEVGKMRHFAPYLERDFVRSAAFNMVQVAVCVFGYYAASNITTASYLQWAEKLNGSNESNPLKQSLPDIYLDYISPDEAQTVILFVADGVPGLLLFVGAFLSLGFRYMDLFNFFCWLLSVSTVGKGISEVLTTLPASMGYDHCVTEILDLQKTDEASKFRKFGINPAGTCADMIWSGHTANSMYGMHLILSVLERRFPGAFWTSSCCGVRVKTLVVGLTGLIIANLALLNRIHYSVDVWLGFLIATLLISNDRFRYAAARLNPFLRSGWVVSTQVEKAMDFDIVANILTKYPHIEEMTEPCLLDARNKRRRVNTCIFPDEENSSFDGAHFL